MASLNSKATVGCLVRYGNKLVLVYEEQNGAGAWDIPAGGIESGETPEQAVWRELQEEIGLGFVSNMHLAQIFWATLDDIPTVHFLYDLTIDRQTFETLQPQTTDIQKVDCLSHEEIQGLILAKAYEHDLAKLRLEYFLNNSSGRSSVQTV